MTEINTKQLYNVKETSKLLGIGKNKAYSLIKNGYLSAMDLGGLKVPRESIDYFIDTYTGFDFKDMSNVHKLHLS